eukprot:scaffold31810_cov18-Tisochrysis_lutea.AAC.1
MSLLPPLCSAHHLPPHTSLLLQKPPHRLLLTCASLVEPRVGLPAPCPPHLCHPLFSPSSAPTALLLQKPPLLGSLHNICSALAASAYMISMPDAKAVACMQENESWFGGFYWLRSTCAALATNSACVLSMPSASAVACVHK